MRLHRFGAAFLIVTGAQSATADQCQELAQNIKDKQKGISVFEKDFTSTMTIYEDAMKANAGRDYLARKGAEMRAYVLVYPEMAEKLLRDFKNYEAAKCYGFQSEGFSSGKRQAAEKYSSALKMLSDTR